MTSPKVDFEGLPWQSSVSGARFKVFQQGKQQLRLVEFTSEFVEEEWCEKAHFSYCLQGEMDLNQGGEVIHFKAGDGIFIPGGTAWRHKVSVPAGKVVLLLVEDINL